MGVPSWTAAFGFFPERWDQRNFGLGGACYKSGAQCFAGKTENFPLSLGTVAAEPSSGEVRVTDNPDCCSEQGSTPTVFWSLCRLRQMCSEWWCRDLNSGPPLPRLELSPLHHVASCHGKFLEILEALKAGVVLLSPESPRQADHRCCSNSPVSAPHFPAFLGQRGARLPGTCGCPPSCSCA